MEKINSLLLVDDHPLLRKGIKQSLLNIFPNVKILEAETIFEASAILHEIEMDIIFLDINLPDGNGIDFLREIKNENSEQKVVILTMYNDTALLQEAIEAKVDAYITKDSDEEELELAINAARHGTRYLSRSVMDAMIKRVEKTDGIRNALSQLTPTEKKVLSLVSEMKSSKEIAEQMFLHYRTIENHRTNICAKLGITGTNALLKFAIENKEYI